MSATTEMNRYAGYRFSSFDDIKNERALYHEYTNTENIKKGFNLPFFGAEKAAEILVSQSEDHDLILYEYFLTDFAGHAQNLDRSIQEIRKIENVIIALLNRMNKKNTTLIVVSDHGNIEDLSTRSHTTNPAFLGIWRKEPIDKSFKFNDLRDLFPFIYYTITGEIPDLPNF
jgi:bisphosphoglycerate-independent phosphoglycerate mutase (AlkP superfamily)